jgi:hypothetical protein
VARNVWQKLRPLLEKMRMNESAQVQSSGL